MNLKYSGIEGQAIFNCYLTGGESVSVIFIQTGILHSTLYAWIKRHCDAQSNGKPKLTLRNFLLLENRVKR